VGTYKNAGPPARPKGEPEEVGTYDFPDPPSPRRCPTACNDLKRNEALGVGGSGPDTQPSRRDPTAVWVPVGSSA